MSYFENKLILLKGIKNSNASGVAKLIKKGQDAVLRLSLTLKNNPYEKDVKVTVLDNSFITQTVVENDFKFVKDFEVKSEFLNAEFSLLVSLIEKDKDIPILFGKTALSKIGVDDFNKNTEMKEKEIVYLDEVVATENYYLKENINFENGNTTISAEDYAKEDDDFDACNKEKEKREIKDEKDCSYETSSIPFQKIDFWESVKEELMQILSTYEREEYLSKTIPFSTFVKIKYDENKFYVVGLIEEDFKPKYICYGIPTNYYSTPPAELEPYCSFLPLSLFRPKGDGYLMMYQDAKNGNCIKLKY